MTEAVAVEGLRVVYPGGKVAVAGLSFEVAAGEVFGLLGPNGAGKTTTVETLEGFRRPTAGRVRVLGYDPVGERAALVPRIGVMLQEGGLYQGLRPLESLRLFAAYYAEPDDPERLLDLVGLRDAATTFARRLSGGQRQRLSLALALVGRPDVVFLDEPTAGMDPHARATTWELVEGLAARGATVVLTTHSMEEAERLCDRLVIIADGALVAAGSPAELTAGTGVTRFTSRPGLDTSALAAHLRLPAADVAEERPGAYRVEAGAAVVGSLAAWLEDHDAGLAGMSAGRRSLEDVFLSLTREETSAGATGPSRRR